jgi:hypothetical protein
VYRLENNGDVVAFKMPPARREEGAYLNRYVTDEQRGRPPIFNATLRAGASWLFLRVARSTRMTQIWALRSRPEKQPTDRRRRHIICETVHEMRRFELCFPVDEDEERWLVPESRELVEVEGHRGVYKSVKVLEHDE